MFEEFENIIDKIESRKVFVDYIKTDERTLVGRELSQMEVAKRIIYLYQDFLVNRGMDTYPQHLIDKLQQNIEIVKYTLNNVAFDERTTIIYQSAVEDGENVLAKLKPHPN